MQTFPTLVYRQVRYNATLEWDMADPKTENSLHKHLSYSWFTDSATS
jgi:hypothetical protein